MPNVESNSSSDRPGRTRRRKPGRPGEPCWVEPGQPAQSSPPEQSTTVGPDIVVLGPASRFASVDLLSRETGQPVSRILEWLAALGVPTVDLAGRQYVSIAGLELELALKWMPPRLMRYLPNGHPDTDWLLGLLDRLAMAYRRARRANLLDHVKELSCRIESTVKQATRRARHKTGADPRTNRVPWTRKPRRTSSSG